jgi:uncharacterized membrane protein
MTILLFFIVALVETAFIGGMFLLYPRFARRGLLFGVYVGEEAWSGQRAAEITRGWYRGMAGWLAAALLLEVALATFVPREPLLGLFPLVLVAGFVVLYVRAYSRAREIAVDTAPPAAAVVGAAPEGSLLLPFLALAAGVVGGVVALTYSGVSYDALPSRVPTHFGLSGAPDAWRPKGFFAVMLLPLMTLVMGVFIGVIAIFTARAKRALRYPNTDISLRAQLRFRTAVTRMMSAIGILIAVLMTLMSVASIRVGLGLDKAMPRPIMALAFLVVVVGAGGTLYIGLRYGQGGSRLERQGAAAPLTDGLADNRHWVLGAFYVNRDDPSFLVEDRFGLGYTINLGNWKAVAAVGGFLAGLLGLVAAALLLM